MKELKYNVDFILPDEMENIKETNVAAFGNSMLLGKMVPGVFLFCESNYLIKAGISKMGHLEAPDYKLKVLKSSPIPNILIYLFEIELTYKNGFSVRIHFNPRDKAFRDFCTLGANSKMLSIHYSMADSTLTTSVHVELDSQNIEWFKRNLQVSKQIKFNSAYTTISDYVKQQFPKSEYFIQLKKNTFLDVRKNES
jgi:hypothetical protein